MTDFEWFLAAIVFCGFVLLYMAAVGDDPKPKVPVSSNDI